MSIRRTDDGAGRFSLTVVDVTSMIDVATAVRSGTRSWTRVLIDLPAHPEIHAPLPIVVFSSVFYFNRNLPSSLCAYLALASGERTSHEYKVE